MPKKKKTELERGGARNMLRFVFLCFFFTGCIHIKYAGGMGYDRGDSGSGKSCHWSIFFFAVGEAGIKDAKNDGNLSYVSYFDSELAGVLWPIPIIRACTIAYGKKRKDE